MDNSKRKTRHFVYNMLFIIYIALLIYFLFFSDTFGRTTAYDEYRYNLQPFAEIKRYITRVRDTDYLMFIINIVGNVALFIPFGFLFPLMTGKNREKLILMFLATFIVTVTSCFIIETIQLLTKVGVFDVDDIIMNACGSVLGYIIYAILVKCRMIKIQRRRAA